jgi:GNAT superfamily N-acetyltransferase
VSEAFEYRIVPLTLAHWASFERLFGPNGACGGCWCMWWRLTRKDFQAGHGEANRHAYKTIVRQGPAPGLLAYKGQEAVGWCQVCPRADLPVLDRSPLLKPVDAQPVWSLSCFYIRPDFRHVGLMDALIEAAKAHARERGAAILEAYPWDVRQQKSPSTIFTGTASTFVRHGFKAVARRVARRPVMRCALGPP